MDLIATLILNQAEAIELSLIESSEFQFVVDGAELVCNGCPGKKTVLQVTSQNKFYMKNKLVATKKDKEPIRNIVPFPSCTFIGECELMIEGDWENYSTNTFSGKKECLTTDSFARCKNGGIIRIEHSGQYLSSEQIAKDSEELFKIAGKTGTSEIKKKEMGEYLSKKYGEKIVVEDFNFKRGNQVPRLVIVIRVQAKNNIFMSEQNKNILHDIENYNKNGVFFHERNKVYEYEQIQSNSVYRGVRDIDFPIKGNVYENSEDYYKKRNISQSELNKTKENWNNKRIKKEEREHKVLNDIKRVKNITVFNKKFDSFWLNELDVELVGSKKDKNGNTILIVNDYGNNLNKIKNQNLIKRYGKNGIKFEKSFVGRQASTLTSLYEYERLKYNYPNEYTDFFTTAPFYYTLKKAQEAIIASAPTEGKNLSGSKEGYVSNDKKSSGSKMNNKEFEKINKEVLETVETNKKRNINVELHKKINERQEGHYHRLQQEKIDKSIKQGEIYRGGNVKIIEDGKLSTGKEYVFLKQGEGKIKNSKELLTLKGQSKFYNMEIDDYLNLLRNEGAKIQGPFKSGKTGIGKKYIIEGHKYINSIRTNQNGSHNAKYTVIGTTKPIGSIKIIDGNPVNYNPRGNIIEKGNLIFIEGVK